MKKVIIILAVFFILSCSETYYGTVEGYVFDSETKEAIEGAIIDDSYISDDSGYFSFTYGGSITGIYFNDPKTINVKVTKEGYISQNTYVNMYKIHNIYLKHE